MPVKVKKQKNTKSARNKRKTLTRKPKNTSSVLARNKRKTLTRKPKNTSSGRKVLRTSKKITRRSGKHTLVYRSTTTTVVEEVPVTDATVVETQSPQTGELGEGSMIDAPPLNIPPPDEESSNVTGSEYRITETAVTESEVETKAVPIDIPVETPPEETPSEETPPEYHKRQSKYEDQTSEEEASCSDTDKCKQG